MFRGQSSEGCVLLIKLKIRIKNIPSELMGKSKNGNKVVASGILGDTNIVLKVDRDSVVNGCHAVIDGNKR
jgi:hypothetical protein